jgi:ELWxxDGT repeat protein
LPYGSIGNDAIVLQTVDPDRYSDQLDFTNGTLSGTSAVGSPDLMAFPSTASTSTALFFTVINPTNDEELLWETNGTAGGTFQLLPTSTDNFSDPTAVGNEVYFVDNTLNELWKTDGTPANTVEVGGSFGTIRDLAAFDDSLAVTSYSGNVLWLINGSTQTPITGAFGSPYDLTATDDELFFTDGSGLWKTKGAGASQVVPDPSNGSFSEVFNITAVKDDVYFTTASVGGVLWRSDGTPGGTEQVSGGFSEPFVLTSAGNTLYFIDVADDTLWGVNNGGTAFDVAPITSFSMAAVGGTLYFVSGVNDDLYETNGSVTSAVNSSEGSFSDVSNLGVEGGQLYFQADDSTYGYQLWTSDGTPTGTFRLTEVMPPNGSYPYDLTAGPSDLPGGPVCYCRGTRILTDKGEVAVESLAIGDNVVTLSGGVRPIKWIGHRVFEPARHSDPREVWPICVWAGAFGENKPSRDLWLSPGHAVAVEGALIQVKNLQNGKSIAQRERSTVEYWHVELDQHDIMIAEDLPAESYLDTGNRASFVNGTEFIELNTGFKPKHWTETCLPLTVDGPEVVRVKSTLLERLKAMGHVTTSEADPHLIAGGKRIEPIELGATRFAFELPAGCANIRLMSRTFIPAHTRPGSADGRSLGLCIKRLQINGDDVALDDESLNWDGWNGFERRGRHRWTRGDARMPPGVRLILIDLAVRGSYWQERKGNVVTLHRQQPTSPRSAIF